MAFLQEQHGIADIDEQFVFDGNIENLDVDKFNRLTDGRLYEAVVRHPQLIDLCDVNKLQPNQVAWLSLIDICIFDKIDNTDKISGCDWTTVLLINPLLGDKCNWNKLNNHDFTRLLSKKPQFEHHCDWSMLTGKNWARLLSKKPQFEHRCDWSKLTSDDCYILLREQPWLIDQCPLSSVCKMAEHYWKSIIFYQPSLKNHPLYKLAML